MKSKFFPQIKNLIRFSKLQKSAKQPCRALQRLFGLRTMLSNGHAPLENLEELARHARNSGYAHHCLGHVLTR